MARVLDEDELIEHWTLVGDELELLTGRTGPSKLGLALWLKFYIAEGRFPSGRSELPDEAVAWVASQVKVPASDIGLFDWEGRTAERTRKTVRTFLGFRECSVADAEKLTTWLADEVLQPGAPSPAGRGPGTIGPEISSNGDAEDPGPCSRKR